MATLSLQAVRKVFGSVAVVHGLDLEVADREFIVLVGPSGCGKSTVLRMIAGLEETSGGRILIDGAVVNEREPKDRDIAMVFQDYALYPHMTVAENMAFALRYRGTPRAATRRRVEETARLLEIAPLLDRTPRQLSGGQRQRVAMGRAIVRDPKIFLFDEPLSNLDAKLRGQMRTEIRKLRERVPTTTVYVTHDQVEAMTLADRIVVMNGGRVEQVGAPDAVYDRPASAFVAGFMGAPAMNLLPARLERDAAVLGDGTRLAAPGRERGRGAVRHPPGGSGLDRRAGRGGGAARSRDRGRAAGCRHTCDARRRGCRDRRAPAAAQHPPCGRGGGAQPRPRTAAFV